jgi:Flp pilus assembly protein TadG
MPRGLRTIPRGPWRRRRAGRRGVAAVEFGIAMPVFALVLVGLVDLGRVVLLRLRLETDVAACVNYAVVNSSMVNSGSGAALAASLGQVMGGNLGGTLTSGVAIVNDGPSVTITNGTAATSGIAGNADYCYCPSGTSSPWTWGSAVPCGSTCGSGTLAGKFVTITETVTYTPIFATYHMVPNNQVSASAIVQVQ